MLSTTVRATALVPLNLSSRVPNRRARLRTPFVSRYLSVWILCFAMALYSQPGKIVADTKLDLTENPWGFLGRATHLWSPDAPLGQVQNQAYGYFFPHGLFFALADSAQLAPWLTQRLWWSVLLCAGYTGLRKLAEVLEIGSPTSRNLAALAFILSPRVLTTIGSISSETLPMMLAPWVLVPVVLAARRPDPRLLRLAAGSALAIAAMGAVNAVTTGWAVAVTVLWWLLQFPRSGPGMARYLRFSGLWALGAVVATIWWIVPLLIMGKVSPSFLDFIESSRTTTEWANLPEVLRGTSSWTPFVSPERIAGSVLVTTPAAVVVTGLLAAAGLAGLALGSGRGRGAMPGRGGWVVILLTGITLIGIGYASRGTLSGLGSPLAEPVRNFLDGAGAPLRNVHKLEPLIRIPLVLGLAHLLATAPSWGRSTSSTLGWSALAHPERHRRAAALLAVTALVVLGGGLGWSGKLAPRGPYDQVPDYWAQTADWLSAHEPADGPQGRALVVPGAPFGAQLWGFTRDEPLQPLAQTPWVTRDAIPLVPPGAIRALDAVEAQLASGRGAAGLRAALADLGIDHVVVRADLDPATSRSARPVLAYQALIDSGLTPATQLGSPVGPPSVEGVVVDSGLRPQLPAITIFSVDPDGTGAPNGNPYLVDAKDVPRIQGGPEALLRSDIAGPVLTLNADGTATDGTTAPDTAGPLLLTDTPKLREIDYGRTDDHSSAVRAVDDPEQVLNAVADYPGGTPVPARWTGAVVTTSGSAADATQLGSVLVSTAATAAFDRDPITSWVSNGLDGAVGKWMKLQFPSPRGNLAVRITVGKPLGPAVNRVVIETDNGQTLLENLVPGVPSTVSLSAAATGSLTIKALGTADGTAGNQFALTEVEALDTATGLAIPISREVLVPAPDGPGTITGWELGQDIPGRSDCVRTPPSAGLDEAVACSGAMGLVPEEPGSFTRTLTVPDAAVPVTTSLTVLPRVGGSLSELLAPIQRLGAYATGAADVIDPRGSAAAVSDGNLATSWTAPLSSTEPLAPVPVLQLHLPRAERITALDITLPAGLGPAAPTQVAINAGSGRQIRNVSPADGNGLTHRIEIEPTVTDTITISLMRWEDEININALGFAEKLPPGLAEVTAIAGDTAIPAAPGDTPVSIPCAFGPVVAVSGSVQQFSIRTTLEALRNEAPIAATPCDAGSAPTVAPGEQVLTVDPGSAFSVATISLRANTSTVSAPHRTAVTTDRWEPERREVTVPAAGNDRFLVIPESVNSGWTATLNGRELTAVTINGWQQGFLIPAGSEAGTIALNYGPGRGYRFALFGGLALLLLLPLALAIPSRRTRTTPLPIPGAWPEAGTQVTRRRVIGGIGVVAVSFALSGVPGLIVAVATGAVAAALSGRHGSGDVPAERANRGGLRGAVGVAVFTTLGMLALARGPWQDSHGYAGFAPGPQALVLGGLLLLGWLAVFDTAGESAVGSRPS